MAEIVIPYRPRDLQSHIHASLKRWNVLVCHRRFGKTVLCINELIKSALQCELERPRFSYISPFYSQAKSVAWDYLKHYTNPIPGRVFNEAELRVDLPGERRIRLYGADNPDALRGIGLDGVVLDEYAQMRPRLMTEVIRPALSDRRGWACFIGTPMGRNAFCKLYEMAKNDPDWFAALYKASETGIIPAEELADARRLMSPDEFEQEYECSFVAAIKGAYYGKLLAQAEKDGRIGKAPWEPQLEVHTAWDLGVGDSTAIWYAQIIGREVRLIDFFQTSGVGAEHYVRELRQKPYVYGQHILPHDAAVREWGTGRSRVETLSSLGINVTVLGSTPIPDGINAARLLIPRCWFDEDKCAVGIEALRQYRREWDERMNDFRAKPRHDEHSHAADAFRYLAMGLPDDVDYGDGQDAWEDMMADEGRSAVTGY